MNKKYRFKYLLPILKYILPLMSNTFFLPMFFVFMSAFDCTTENTSLYSDELKCYTIFFYINYTISFISLILYVPMCLLVVTLFYEYALEGETKPLSKTTSIPDVFFFWEKMLITFIFVVTDGEFYIHLFLILTLIIFSSFSVYLNYIYERYNEELLNYMHKFLSLTFLWASLCLGIGKLTMNIKFNGCLGLFFSVEPMFFLILFYRKKNLKSFLYKIGKKETLKETLLHIKNFLYLFDKKNEYREVKIILNSYIQIYEETCTIKKCPLKKYLKLLKEGIEANGCLLQHANLLFTLGINKYPDNVEIKFAYALFLLKKLNRRKKAANYLKSIKALSPTIEEEFIIFRCKRIFEDNLSDLKEGDGDNYDIIKELKFRNHNKTFIDLIKESSTLYIDFWNQLLDSYYNDKENVNELNNCGTKINRINDEIEYIFHEMRKLKANNIELLKIYYEFVSKKLCDKKKCFQYKNIINELNQ